MREEIKLEPGTDRVTLENPKPGESFFPPLEVQEVMTELAAGPQPVTLVLPKEAEAINSDFKELIAAGFPEEFLKKYYKAMTAWALQHGNVNFPISTTPIVNNKGETIRIEYRWVNRKARRAR